MKARPPTVSKNLLALAYNQGRRAHARGRKPESCSIKHPVLAVEWLRGWTDHQAERVRAALREPSTQLPAGDASNGLDKRALRRARVFDPNAPTKNEWGEY